MSPGSRRQSSGLPPRISSPNSFRRRPSVFLYPSPWNMNDRAYIGIGSNLGDRIKHCHETIGAISEIAGVAAMRASSLYETAPVPPASGGWFVNGVVSVQTHLALASLLRELQRIER